MISTIFEKNRLNRLLKPILGRSAPGYMVGKRHKFGADTNVYTFALALNGNLALSYARFEGRKANISSSPHAKIAIQPLADLINLDEVEANGAITVKSTMC